jgi:hypothetical protein
VAVPQITIRLSPEAKTGFQNYARSLGMRASELAKLLIVREQRLCRLAKQARSGSEIDRDKRGRNETVGKRWPTVTAHLSDLNQLRKFDEYAKGCGLNRSSAGAWLCEKELQERWLDKAISAPENRRAAVRVN